VYCRISEPRRFFKRRGFQQQSDCGHADGPRVARHAIRPCQNEPRPALLRVQSSLSGPKAKGPRHVPACVEVQSKFTPLSTQTRRRINNFEQIAQNHRFY